MDGVPRTLRAGEELLITAGDWHTYKALEPSQVECIFHIRDANGELLGEIKQQYLAAGGAF
jgi:quercetin dioxygenase-like cupin family protein